MSIIRRPRIAVLAGLTLCLALLAGLGPRPAAAQGFERTYTLVFSECTQTSLGTFLDTTPRFRGFLDQRPINCGRTSCSYQYTSRISPNDLLQSLYGMIEGQGYRARIGVEGLRYAIICLPGRRSHPLAPPPQPEAGGFPAPKVPGYAEFETECGSVIDAAGDVLFNYDSAGIREDAAAVLSQIADRIRALDPVAIEITGHTDSRGSAAYNQQLSLRRAGSVAAFFRGPLRVVGPQFLVRGRGEREPRRPNRFADGSDNPQGRQANRRVEIFLRRVSGGPNCAPPPRGGPEGYRLYGEPLRGPGEPVYQYRRPKPRQSYPPVEPEQW
ncbi:hypothetical protein LNKW23_34620 [Paralimibaculum aggregatum]|uniref:OmpA-like domain-containing protein n=1 Tax=Paralimibaculum aggregatum TaxID=3036245 RepID=A0ABQ6LQI4_9RHOB|nr:OmpA family protein [Limibaculum sp. NKW23]GMG84247.1 hypothetical protein LNKW23_34620 [Limibaculum sp. NKW23]